MQHTEYLLGNTNELHKASSLMVSILVCHLVLHLRIKMSVIDFMYVRKKKKILLCVINRKKTEDI